jgi:hypothetical protein
MGRVSEGTVRSNPVGTQDPGVAGQTLAYRVADVGGVGTRWGPWTRFPPPVTVRPPA